MQRKWWKESVVYQIYPRSFFDSSGDGIGDLRGILQKLEYLEMLGVDLLWLNPVYASPDVDNGYDISDYQAIHPRFGTLEDLQALIDQAHRRGMRIMMDLVVNHTSDQHPWFAASRASKDNPYRDFYIWRDGRGGREPNNWKAHFSKSAWTFDERTGQYYLHTFSPFQPDLNWENPDLRAAVYEMVRWWLEKGIDGFRLDAISFISKAPGLPDNPGEGETIFDLRHMMNGPQYHAWLRELNREALRGFDIVTVGECIGLTVESAVEVSAPEREELNMPFLFEHTDQAIESGKDTRMLKEILTKWQVGLHGRGWIGMAFNNHDLPRVVSLFGDDGRLREASAKLFGTLLLTLEGTPFIYQGEEIGMTNVAFPSIDDYNDIAMVNLVRELVEEQGMPPAQALEQARARSRDNARTPMQWSAGPQAGFTSGTPWIQVNPRWREINVEQALADPDSIFYHYRALIRLRKERLALVYGSFEPLLPEHEQIYAYLRALEDERLLVVLNISAREAQFELPAGVRCAGAELLIGNYPAGAGEDLRRLTLRPYEARVYRLPSLAVGFASPK